MATLTLNFTSDNNPTNGYIVKYRQVGTTDYSTQLATSSPITIEGLGSGVSYEGTIQADCGNGRYGTLTAFTSNVPAKFNVSRDPSSASNACSSTNYNYVFYAASAVLQTQMQLYTDRDLNSAFTTAGYYSNGTKVYQVDASGRVVSIANCTN